MITPIMKQFLIFHCYTILLFAGYIVFFRLFQPIIGDSIAIFSFIPVVVIAWLRGIRRGVAAAVLADVLVVVLFRLEGTKSWETTALLHRLPGFIAVVLIAVLVGYMHGLRERIKKELAKNKQVEAELRLSEELLRAKNTEILDYANMLTHDLKKPLSVMKTVCSLVKNGSFGELSGDGSEALCTGSEAITYMETMLNDLLLSAKLEAGTSVLARQKVRWGTIAEQVLTRLKYQIKSKDITVVTKGLDITVDADPKSLDTILMNLVGNAIAYIGPGADRQISITGQMIDEQLRISVQDNGIGIPIETQKSLFQKFKRGSNVSGISGTGLGLSIVKGMVLAHGGAIWVDSTEGKGTTFHFTLG